MYTCTTAQTNTQPQDSCLIEGYPGEAKDLILQSYLDNGMLSSNVYAENEYGEEEITLAVSDFLSPEEIAQLESLELTATEKQWDSFTPESLEHFFSEEA